MGKPPGKWICQLKRSSYLRLADHSSDGPPGTWKSSGLLALFPPQSCSVEGTEAHEVENVGHKGALDTAV